MFGFKALRISLIQPVLSLAGTGKDPAQRLTTLPGAPQHTKAIEKNGMDSMITHYGTASRKPIQHAILQQCSVRENASAFYGSVTIVEREKVV